MQNVLKVSVPLVLFIVTLVTLGSLVSRHSLYHDEAVYLTKARAWIDGAPADEFKIYRPVGMAWFGWIFLHFGSSERTLRIFGVIFGAVAAVLIYLAFRRIFNGWIALGGVAAVVSSSLFLKQAPLFLNDIPSAALLVAILGLLYHHYETAGKSRSVYLAGILIALAFYLRYGVVSAFGVVAALSLFILYPRFRRQSASFIYLRNTLILTLLLLAPHFIYSLISTKSIIGILELAGKFAGRQYLGEGVLPYLEWLPHELGGWVLGITAIAGIIATSAVLVLKSWRQEYPNVLWIGGIGFASLIVTGIVAHPEARYIFFSAVLLSGAGIAGAYYLISRWSASYARLLVAAFTGLSLYAGIVHYQDADSSFKKREVERYHTAYVAAAEAIRNDASGDSCAVWSVLFRPAISWYSRCDTLEINGVFSFKRDANENSGKSWYSMVFTDTDGKQIDQSQAENFGVKLSEIFREKNLPYGDLIVYRIETSHAKVGAQLSADLIHP